MDDGPNLRNFASTENSIKCVQSKNIPAFLAAKGDELWLSDFKSHLKNCSFCHKKILATNYSEVSLLKFIPFAEMTSETALFLDSEIDEMILKTKKLMPEGSVSGGLFENIKSFAQKLFQKLV